MSTVDLNKISILKKYFPDNIVNYIEKRGIKNLYPTQVKAINAGLLDKKNIVLSAPTASGKTFVAVLSMLKHLLEGGKILYLTPLRALASEKYKEFREFFTDLGYKTIISTGDYDSSDPWLGRYDVIVTTNEKADSLVRHRSPWLSDITLIVIDEIHILGTERRGATLEVLLTRLKQENKNTQFLGLSATIRNLEEVAEWLSAIPVKVDWRPVMLKEGVYYDGEIYFNNGETLKLGYYDNPLFDLSYDTLKSGGQILIFAPTRRISVSSAKKLANIAKKFLDRQTHAILSRFSSRLKKLSSDKITVQLAELIAQGAAFHHAGLSPQAREIVEDLFRKNMLKVIVATPTLAAGVNLPARRVVISSYRRFNVELGYYERIPVMEYKQMAGRAGRPQYDEYGEAVLIGRTLEEVDFLFEEYIKSEPEKIISQLGSEPVLRSQLLSIISTGNVDNINSLEQFLSETFYATQYGIFSLQSLSSRILYRLAEKGLIVIEDEKIESTAIGKRVAELYIDPETAITGVEFFQNFEKASMLGYIVLLTFTPDMPIIYVRKNERENLERRMENRRDEIPFDPPFDEFEYEYYLSRLKTAFLIEDWINEMPEDYIVERYDVGPGDIYSITQTAEWISYSLSKIAELLGYHVHSSKLLVLSKRIKHGVKEELLELVSIKGIGRVRARNLYNYGFRSLFDIINADIVKLASVPGIGLTLAKKLKKSLEAEEEGSVLEDQVVEEDIQTTIDRYF